MQYSQQQLISDATEVTWDLLMENKYTAALQL